MCRSTFMAGALAGNKLYLLPGISMAILNTLMAVAEQKQRRLFLLVAVLVLQHATLLLFMVGYDFTLSEVVKKKEQAEKNELKEDE